MESHCFWEICASLRNTLSQQIILPLPGAWKSKFLNLFFASFWVPFILFPALMTGDFFKCPEKYRENFSCQVKTESFFHAEKRGQIINCALVKSNSSVVMSPASSAEFVPPVISIFPSNSIDAACRLFSSIFPVKVQASSWAPKTLHSSDVTVVPEISHLPPQMTNLEAITAPVKPQQLKGNFGMPQLLWEITVFNWPQHFVAKADSDTEGG